MNIKKWFMNDESDVFNDGLTEQYYNLKAEEIRNKRNQLLADSDKNMVLDRINFEIPKEITLTNIVTVIKELFNTISTIKNGAWAVYRQELRDITKQKGFPYEVEFPKKPE